MTDGIKDLLASERGVFCIMILIAASLLAVFGTLTAQQWLACVQWLVTVLVASKTVTGVAELMRPASPAAAAASKQEAASQ